MTSPNIGGSEIDFDFISEFEGGSINQGYVPDAKNSQSGVTVAIGFDLGARDTNDLYQLGFDDELVGLLRPYMGLKGLEAADFVSRNPLMITDAQADVINYSVKGALINKLMRRYEEATNIAFRNLPAVWQTVIASVEFQYGSVQSKCPTFWRCVCSQDWQRAINELRNFGDRYPTRRNKEADYAQRGI